MDLSNLLNPEIGAKNPSNNASRFTPAALIRSPTSDQSLLDAEPDSSPDFQSPSSIPLAPPRSDPALPRRNDDRFPTRTTRRSGLRGEDDITDDSSSLSSLEGSDGEDRYEEPNGSRVESEDSDWEEELGRKRPSKARDVRAKKRIKEPETWSDDLDTPNGRWDRPPPRQSTSRLDTPLSEPSTNHLPPDSSTSQLPPSYVLQSGDCLRNVNGKRLQDLSYSKCHQCTFKLAEKLSSCAFRGLRWFPCELAVPIEGQAVFDAGALEDDIPQFPHPSSFNEEFTPEIALEIKIAASRGLLPTLELELQHAQRPEAIKVKLDLLTRSTCDACNTSIFCASLFCRDCGREYCLECTKEVLSGKGKDRDLKCHKAAGFHRVEQLLPFTRYHVEELKRIVEAMTKVLEENPIVEPLEIAPEKLESYYEEVDGFQRLPSDESLPILFVPLHELDPLLAARPSVTPDCNEIPTATPTVDSATILASNQLVKSLVARGEPIITAIDPTRWKMHYSPEQFIKEHGEDPCLILSNVDQSERSDHVENFFGEFGIERDITDSKKIKVRIFSRSSLLTSLTCLLVVLQDWPSSADFKIAFRTKFDHVSVLVVPFRLF